MKTSLRNWILAGVAGVALISAAVAVAGGPGCSGFGRGQGGFGPAAMGHGSGDGSRGPMGHGTRARGHGPMGMGHDGIAGAQLDGLKQALQLTAEQEPAWNAFAEAAQAQAKRMVAWRDDMRKATQTLPERIDRASQFTQERERAFAEVGTAAKNLYGVLTPTQRAQLDSRGPWMH